MKTSTERYEDYRQTDYWKRVADATKAKAGYRCQVCNSPHDLAAHHRTYEHRGREIEHIEDMTCLCRRCHGIFHGTIPQIAPSAPTPSVDVMVLITRDNYTRLLATKEPWHWMRAAGINPKKSGWAERAVGHMVPLRWLRS